MERPRTLHQTLKSVVKYGFVPYMLNYIRAPKSCLKNIERPRTLHPHNIGVQTKNLKTVFFWIDD